MDCCCALGILEIRFTYPRSPGTRWFTYYWHEQAITPGRQLQEKGTRSRPLRKRKGEIESAIRSPGLEKGTFCIPNGMQNVPEFPPRIPPEFAEFVPNGMQNVPEFPARIPPNSRPEFPNSCNGTYLPVPCLSAPESREWYESAGRPRRKGARDPDI